MSISIAFWVLMLVWLVFGGIVAYNKGVTDSWVVGGSSIVFILLFLLGWAVFGVPIRN